MAVKSLKRHKLDYVLRISDGQNLFAQALTCVVNIHQRNGNSVLYPQPLFFFSLFFSLTFKAWFLSMHYFK